MVTYRIILSNILREFKDVKIVGTAGNGKIALEKIAELKPDVVTLDVEMPVMDGLTALREIRRRFPDVTVIMVSGASRCNADITIKALEAGAFDFIVKPDAESAEAARNELSKALFKQLDNILARKDGAKSMVRTPVAEAPPARLTGGVRTAVTPEKFKVIAIGISTGGPKALAALIPDLSEHLPPVLIVQHMPPVFTKSLADNLNRHAKLRVKEAEEGELLQAGTAYIAPGGRHMVMRKAGPGVVIGLNDNPPENSCRPSVDVLFRAIANQVPPGKTLSLILTGMGSDGLKGVQTLKRHGAYCIVQDEATCVVYGMPRAIVENGLADEILPLSDIGRRINTLAGAL